MNNAVATIVLFFAIFGLVGISEILHRKKLIAAEISRKIVHIGVGTLIFLSYPFLESAEPVIILSAIFIIINALTLMLGVFKGMEGVDRESIGTVLYPLSVLIITIPFFRDKIIYFTSLSALFYGDALAAIVGNGWPLKVFQTPRGSKSLVGSLALGTIVFLVLTAFFKVNLFAALIFSILAIALEAGFYGGVDNLTLPLGLVFFLFYIERSGLSSNFICGFILALILALVSIYMKFLTFDGSVVTFLIGTLIFSIGGLKWGLPIITFFITSSILTKLVKGRSVVKSGEARDSIQVLANGGLPTLFVMLSNLISWKYWYVLYIVSLAVVNSDTWSTEIGTLSKFMPRSIVNFKRLTKGSSGAVSLCGTFGGLVGSFLIASFLLIYGFNFKLFFIAGIAGFLGNIIDSFLGATVEVQYFCKKCGGIFDIDTHCGEKLEYLRGIRWFGNNMVNFTASLLGSIIAALIFWIGGIK